VIYSINRGRPSEGAPRKRCYFFFAAGFFAAGFFAAGFFAAGFFAGAAFFAAGFFAAGFFAAGFFAAGFFAAGFFAAAIEPPLPSWCDIGLDSPSMPSGTTAMQKFATM